MLVAHILNSRTVCRVCSSSSQSRLCRVLIAAVLPTSSPRDSDICPSPCGCSETASFEEVPENGLYDFIGAAQPLPLRCEALPDPAGSYKEDNSGAGPPDGVASPSLIHFRVLPLGELTTESRMEMDFD